MTLPPHRREPGARRRHRGRARHRGARLAPTGKPWRRRARIDPSHSREVLAPILKHIHEAVPHLAWTSKGPRVEAVGPDLAAPSEDAVHCLGKPDPEALHTARERAAVLRLHHQVHVISLDGELENPELASRCPREPAAKSQDKPLFPQRGQQAIRAKGHMDRVPLLVQRPRAVWNADLASRRFSASPAASPAPSAKTDFELAGMR